MESDLADRYRLVAFDLRGHGFSAKSDRDPAADYGDPGKRADDLRAVIDLVQPARPVLVAWSYGNEIVLEYIEKHGQDRIRGLVLVAGSLGPDYVGPVFTDHYPGMTGNELDESGEPRKAEDACMAQFKGCFGFLRGMTARPLSDRRFTELLAGNLMTPAFICEEMGMKRTEPRFEETLKALDIPVLAMHGGKDRVVPPGTTDRMAEIVPDIRIKRRPELGYALFMEDPAAFNRDLRRFMEEIGAAPG